MGSGDVVAQTNGLARSGTGDRAMVVTAHPIASQVGMAMLAAGGSAADAAVAIQTVLTLVEPQSSGLGGGAFALHWRADQLLLDSYDGRETAPMSAAGDLFLKDDGDPMPFWDAVIGGRSVGTPGTVRLLERLHQDHGRIDWEILLQPAIGLAETGFPISPRLHASIDAAQGLFDDSVTAAYFFGLDGRPRPVGHILKNQPYADLLTRIAREGGDAFYKGPIAEDIVEKVQGHPVNPGLLSIEDMAAYRAVRRAPVCGLFRVYRVCGMGPPSSGGLTVGQILGIYDAATMAKGPAGANLVPGGSVSDHIYAEASRLAYADRGQYMADADYVSVPEKALLDPDYLAQRAALIDLVGAMDGRAEAGEYPATQMAAMAGADGTQKDHGTTHFTVVDADGNIVSYTGSIESAFGSRQMVHGILLNNQLTDFSFRPMDEAGKPIANRVEPGKRPRSSMAPTIVFDHLYHPTLAIGSPGGSRIIGYVARAILHILDGGLSPAEAVAQPHIGNRNSKTEIEQGAAGDPFAQGLALKGHEVVRPSMVSGLHAIQFQRDAEGNMRLVGGADPRREGHVVGN
ncbi:MAG: gamma-glutamyltransferase [Alphaproteobacteria bacterium]|nr:gamma-glutamyltransferase [Alphaproteobacteria bacterium SS10]